MKKIVDSKFSAFSQGGFISSQLIGSVWLPLICLQRFIFSVVRIIAVIELTVGRIILLCKSCFNTRFHFLVARVVQ